MKKYLMNRSVRKALLLFAAGVLLTFLTAFREYRSDTLREGYILREEAGGEPFEAEARAKTDSSSHTLLIPVAPRLLSEEEADALLAAAEEDLNSFLFSERDPDRITAPLPLPETLENGLVGIVWTSDRPDLLRWDGSLGEQIPETGAPVTLTAELSVQGRIRTAVYSLSVYPEQFTGEKRFEKEVLDAVRRSEDRTEDRVFLPDTVEGKAVRWSRPFSGTPVLILLLCTACAVLSVFAAKSRETEAQKKKEEAMMLDYPSVTGKLVLLLHAGLSARSAIGKIALDYGKTLESSAKIRPGYEEFVTMYRDMNRGVTEIEAYRGLARRTALPSYRTLSALLAQNLTKGSRTLLEVLDKEAGNAWEERRKRARINGEQASLKLLFPMMIMLGIVLVIMIVPAFMTLY
ncbi:MAG: type II secretion system F family protein [Lachnospiraceae bacterium]|nr:type II secretion system F family protein [Lachnospiraceae bacterium]